MPEPLDPSRLDLLPGSELAELVRRCPDAPLLRFRDGEQLLREGDTGRDLLVVARGSLVVERNGNPPALLAQLSADEDAPVVLGEMAYFGAEPRSASVRCVGTAFAVVLAPVHVDLVLDAFPGLTRLICRQFTSRLRETSAALAEFRRGQDLGGRPRHLQDGEPLFAAGAPAASTYQLVLGRLRVEGPEGTHDLGPEDLPGGFLELGPWLRQEPHGCSARAEGPAVLAEVESGRRSAFLRRFPDLALAALTASGSAGTR